MTEQEKILWNVKPLADPIRTISVAAAVFGVVSGGIFALRMLAQDEPGWVAFLEWVLIFLLGLAWAWLIEPGGQPNAIYLRAFRSDNRESNLKPVLQAILGSDFRVAGIRPPSERTWILTRFAFQSLLVLRYAGSTFMDLEAGNDWLARLWKSCQSMRVAFIDLRDLTTHVHKEIQLTWCAMGSARCIYLVDDQLTTTEWTNLLATIIGHDVSENEVKLLDVSKEAIQSASFRMPLRQLIKSLPSEPAGDSAEGRDFILTNVDARILKKSGSLTPATLIGAILGVLLSLAINNILFANFLPAALRYGCFTVLICLGLLSWAIPAIRVAAFGYRLLWEGHRKAAFRQWRRLLGVAGLFLILILCLGVTLIPGIYDSGMANQ